MVLVFISAQAENNSSKMKPILTFVILAFGIAFASATSDYTQATNCSQKWDFAKTSFTLPGTVAQNSPSLFTGPNVPGYVPQQIDISTLASQECVHNTDNGKFNGVIGLVIKGKYNSDVRVLYTYPGGFIAGVQLVLNRTEVDTVNFNYGSQPSFQPLTVNGQQNFLVTTYFVDPSTICSPPSPNGRSQADFDSQGTGNTFYLQNGATPDQVNLLNGPLCRNDALNQGYSNNKCFPGMGNHTFFGVEGWQANNCSSITPVFLLFDSTGRLVGFGFAVTGFAENDAVEHPPSGAIKIIVGNPPDCLLNLANTKKLTTMHFFFTRKTYNCGLSPDEFADKMPALVEKIREQLKDFVGTVAEKAREAYNRFTNWLYPSSSTSRR